MEIKEGVHITPQREVFVDWFCLQCGQHHRIAEVKPQCSGCGAPPTAREQKGVAQGLSLGERIVRRIFEDSFLTIE